MPHSTAITIFALTLAICNSIQARPLFGKKALVVSASDLASQAGIQAIKNGGNVVDAAVATEFALAVTRPYYASLGGGGFALIRINGEVMALDFRERAPIHSRRDMFLSGPENASTKSGLAVATPGIVSGFYTLHKKYGRRPWRENLQAAIDLAVKGFVITEEFERITAQERKDFTGSGNRIFDSASVRLGKTFRQPNLANALRIIQSKGAKGFYEGEIARDIVDSVKRQNGVLRKEDLTQYASRWKAPLHASIFGADIWTMPPPSSGGALLLSELKQAQIIELPKVPAYSAQEYFLFAEIMRRAFFDRRYLADEGFMKIPVETIYSDERAKTWASTIDKKRKSKIDGAKFELTERGQTTHFNIADSEGNAVAATVTVNTEYGSGIFTEKFGINLNNEMDDFTTKPGQANTFGLTQAEANEVAPLKTPLSSMTPTLVEKNGKFLMALGAPGGPRIINAVFQGLYHALHTQLTSEEIIQAPRVHHQWTPDYIQHDTTISPTLLEELKNRGYETKSGSTARLYLIKWNENSSALEGAFDHRGEGGSAAY